MHGQVLLVSIGNTNTTIVSLDGERRFSHSKTYPTQNATPMLWKSSTDDLQGIVISSVVPGETDQMVHWAHRRNVPVVKVSARGVTASGLITSIYDDMGADRVSNTLGLVHRDNLPALSIDAGTAITMEVVKPGPQFAGGMILPGPDIMARALGGNTALLPRISMNRTEEFLARTTESSIRSGCWWGAVAMVQGLLKMVRNRGVEVREIVLTGGLAELISPHIEQSHCIDSMLCFRGMRTIWEAYGSGNYPW